MRSPPNYWPTSISSVFRRDPDSIIEFNSAVVFVADDGLTGSELWTSDGTESGTVQIADLVPGADGSQPEELTVVGGNFFFTALDEDRELDLWKSDGTTAGTVKVFDADAAGVYDMGNLTASGGKLFFTAFEQTTGSELWVSDGTSGGTMLVTDINPDQQNYYGPQELTDVGGTLYFSSYQNGYDNRELFKYDESVPGVVLVADINSDPYEGSNPSYLTNVGGTLFFAAENSTDGVELYKIDGTTGGAVQISDLNVGSAHSYPEDLTPFNGQLFFSANDGSGRQLFKSDGTSITLVANTTGTGDPSYPTDLKVAGNKLFFASIGGVVPGPVSAVAPTLNPSPNSNSRFDTSGSDTGWAGVLISVDGDGNGFQNQGRMRTATSSGLSIAAPAGDAGAIGAPGVGLSALGVNDLYLRNIGGTELQVYQWDWEISDPGGLTEIDFSGFISGNEFERLQTDPVPEGARFELFLNGAPAPIGPLVVDGSELDDWSGTRGSGNIALSDPGGATITSAVVRMTLLGPSGVNGGNEALVVGATLTAIGGTSGTAGKELFTSNGTGAELVKNIVFVGSSNPSDFTEVNGKLFFTADDPIVSGRELWVSDGTEDGTQLVQDIHTGSDSSGVPRSGDPQQLTEFNNQLLFTVVDDLNDRELWASDGTSAGTDRVKNINAGSQGSNIQQVTPVGNKVFFVADDGINGEAVWVADPVAGTVTLAADVTGSPIDKVSGLTEFNGGVAFYNDIADAVYHTDGSAPTLLTTMNLVDLDGPNPLFVEANGLLFFVSDAPGFGEELHTVTPGGVTNRVADLYMGPTGSNPRGLVVLNNEVYFSASSFDGVGETGVELFKSDGATVSQVKDINSGVAGASSSPADLTVSGNQLFFTADDGINGRELWVSDGSVDSAQLLEIRSGAESSSPTNLTDVGGTLYLSANNGSNGVEPFMSDGTIGGTAMVANLNSGDSNPNGFVQVGASVYFSAFVTATGRELYRTDGTPAGTSLVEDLQPGPASSNPIPLADAGLDRVLVSAVGSGVVNRGMWIAGGPLTSMALAADMNVQQIVDVGPDRLTIADDGFVGEEVFRLIEVAPGVNLTDIMDGAVQRSSIGHVTVTFDQEVEFTTDPFTIVNTQTAETVNHVASITSQNGQTVVDVTFITGPSVNANGLLLDGTYELTINAAQVHSLGLTLDGDGDGSSGDNYVFGDQTADDFFRKYGDNDGNNLVNLFDFAAFRATFGVPSDQAGFNAALDNEGDGDVDLFDFAAFRSNFGT